MLNGVYTSVRSANHIVEDHECSLEGGKLNESFECFGVDLAGFEDLLATSAQARQVEVCLSRTRRGNGASECTCR